MDIILAAESLSKIGRMEHDQSAIDVAGGHYQSPLRRLRS